MFMSYSALKKTRSYIENQQQHRKTVTFEEEYIKFLKLHKVVMMNGLYWEEA